MMSGYKRVNFYELCRLCASNQQKEKTHIFHEEGRKIQLQTKIQSLLSLKVCENDYLPKVVCSRCLQCLEECYTFRNECVTSESMLSSYFNNYRYKEDFTKTGKVYIKDTSVKTDGQPQYQTIPTITVTPRSEQPQLILPMQTQQAETLSKSRLETKSPVFIRPKEEQHQHPPSDAITINSNGEIVNIGTLVDLAGIINSQAAKKPKIPEPKKTVKEEPNDDDLLSFGIQKAKKKAVATYQQHQQQQKLEPKVSISQNVIINPVTVPISSAIRNITVPLTNVTTQSYQNTLSTQKILETINTTTQKIVENFSTTLGAQTCYYTNQIGYTTQQIEQNVTTPNEQKPTTTVEQSATTLNTITPNWAESITVPNQLIDKSKVKTEKAYECEICKRTFKRREHLYQHIKLHTGFRPFTCESCSKSFMRKEHLLRHMTSHSGLKNFTCDVCEKSFSRNDNLLKHKKTHDKESNFTCEICHKQFVMRHYYIAHKVTHETEARQQTNVWAVKA